MGVLVVGVVDRRGALLGGARRAAPVDPPPPVAARPPRRARAWGLPGRFRRPRAPPPASAIADRLAALCTFKSPACHIHYPRLDRSARQMLCCVLASCGPGRIG